MTYKLYFLYIFSIVFSPLISLGIMHLRLEQIIIFFILVLILLTAILKGKILIYKPARYMFVFLFFYVFFILVSTFLVGQTNVYHAINFPLKIVLYFLISFTFIYWINKKDSLQIDFLFNIIFFIVFLVSIFAILQYLEMKLLSSNIILSITHSIYPYMGTLSEVDLLKTGGYYIKSGGAGRVVGTFEGQPILFSNFLSITVVLFLYKLTNIKNIFMWLIIFIALALTLSRGAIIAAAIGIMTILFLFLVIRQKQGLKTFVKAIGALIIVFLVYKLGIFDSITWRIQSSINTLIGVGPIEGRTASVWPSVIEHISSYGWNGWLFGTGATFYGPSDSMYMWLLVNSGIIGLVIFVFFHLLLLVYFLKKFIKLKRKGIVSYQILCFLGVIVTLLNMYIVHPVWQGDRFLSMFFTIIAILYFTKSTESYRQNI